MIVRLPPSRSLGSRCSPTNLGLAGFSLDTAIAILVGSLRCWGHAKKIAYDSRHTTSASAARGRGPWFRSTALTQS